MGMIWSVAAALVGNPAGQVTVGGALRDRTAGYTRRELHLLWFGFLVPGIRCEPAWSSPVSEASSALGCRVNIGWALILPPHWARSKLLSELAMSHTVRRAALVVCTLMAGLNSTSYNCSCVWRHNPDITQQPASGLSLDLDEWLT